MEGFITIYLKNDRAYLSFQPTRSTDGITADCGQRFLQDYMPVFLAACQDLDARKEEVSADAQASR
jgi:hypothetical protein